MTDVAPTLSPHAVLHSVHIGWKPDVGRAHGARVAEALKSYAANVSGLLFYRAGTDLGLRPNAPDFGIVALFDNAASYSAYADDEGHQAIIAELIAPFARTRTATQIAVDS